MGRPFGWAIKIYVVVVVVVARSRLDAAGRSREAIEAAQAAEAGPIASIKWPLEPLDAVYLHKPAWESLARRPAGWGGGRPDVYLLGPAWSSRNRFGTTTDGSPAGWPRPPGGLRPVPRGSQWAANGPQMSLCKGPALFRPPTRNAGEPAALKGAPSSSRAPWKALRGPFCEPRAQPTGARRETRRKTRDASHQARAGSANRRRLSIRGSQVVGGLVALTGMEIVAHSGSLMALDKPFAAFRASTSCPLVGHSIVVLVGGRSG